MPPRDTFSTSVCILGVTPIHLQDCTGLFSSSSEYTLLMNNLENFIHSKCLDFQMLGFEVVLIFHFFLFFFFYYFTSWC